MSSTSPSTRDWWATYLARGVLPKAKPTHTPALERGKTKREVVRPRPRYRVTFDGSVHIRVFPLLLSRSAADTRATPTQYGLTLDWGPITNHTEPLPKDTNTTCTTSQSHCVDRYTDIELWALGDEGRAVYADAHDPDFKAPARPFSMAGAGDLKEPAAAKPRVALTKEEAELEEEMRLLLRSI